MIYDLKDVSMNTFIAEVPAIVNSNNNAIRNEFSNLYDEESNVLLKDVSCNLVNSRIGKFTNLQADYINFSDSKHFQEAILSALIRILNDKNSVNTENYDLLKSIIKEIVSEVLLENNI